VTHRHGRKASIVCGGVSFLIGAALNVAAVNLAMLILGRIMLGVGIGFGNQAVPLYLSEMAPAHLRGGLNMMFQLATTLGIFTANLINYGTQNIRPWGWRLSLGLAAAPALLMTLAGLFLPETPNSLIERGRVEEGRRVLERIRGTADVDAEFTDMVEASELNPLARGSLVATRTHSSRLLLPQSSTPGWLLISCLLAVVVVGVGGAPADAEVHERAHGHGRRGGGLLVELADEVVGVGVGVHALVAAPVLRHDRERRVGDAQRADPGGVAAQDPSHHGRRRRPLLAPVDDWGLATRRDGDRSLPP
jgi:MFS family permease